MVEPILTPRTPRIIIWDINANVGLASPNKDDDVGLVKLGYFFLAQSAPRTMQAEPALRGAIQALNLNSGCTGQESDPLVKVIRLHQRVVGGEQDGRVSRIPANGISPRGDYVSQGTSHRYLLNILTSVMMGSTPDIWPRIDQLKTPSCPDKLAESIRKACTL